jgi:uncharacterized protein YjbJ (UPF0337 family)
MATKGVRQEVEGRRQKAEGKAKETGDRRQETGATGVRQFVMIAVHP